MAKAKPLYSKKMKNKKQFDFSESEIDVAEQLIQLSGDSNNHNDKNNNDDNNHHDLISDGDTAHLTNNIGGCKHGVKDFFDAEDDGFDQRRKKRFRSLSEIYSLTSKPLSLVNHR
ncbi:hypothetical protein TIFTF001_028147 [Ficus carica]|uniref:Uncharacterized protein n=1 Tax=Ficus carica TaxID=3494 RepID=A0AA88DPC7_FICCA|nr:hypothetical protein TIFTF001_028147 [Ficus carica]